MATMRIPRGIGGLLGRGGRRTSGASTTTSPLGLRWRRRSFSGGGRGGGGGRGRPWGGGRILRFWFRGTCWWRSRRFSRHRCSSSLSTQVLEKLYIFFLLKNLRPILLFLVRICLWFDILNWNFDSIADIDRFLSCFLLFWIVQLRKSWSVMLEVTCLDWFY